MIRRRRKKNIVNQIKESALQKEEKTIIKKSDLLSTGSTLLNLACSDNTHGGFLKGKYYFLVGDSSSGKTFLSLTCFAESSLHKEFKKYRLIYDDVEGGNEFDIKNLFGEKTAKRLEFNYSQSIEEFYYALDDACNEERPFIYVLDSMDGLTSESEADKFKETKEAFEKGKQTAGSYGDGKAKKNSSGIRQCLRKLRDSGSILIIINQTRDNIGFGHEKKTRSGGHALKFYATIELWSSIKGKIKKTVNKKPRQIGVLAQVKVKKNRLTGREHIVELPIFWSYGIDDIGSCLDYLDSEKFDYSKYFPNMPKDILIKYIEEKEKQDLLKQITEKCWLNIKERLKLKRKKRYE